MIARNLSLALCVTLMGCWSSIPAEGVKIGSPAPAWEGLPGTDGKAHSLADFKDAKAVVVAFTCNHCPVAVAYEDRFIEFAKAYEEKGVAFVAINCNNVEADRLPAMKQRAAEKGFNFPYVYDESQKSGHDFGAKSTPHLFVLDGDRNVVYIGAFDDSQSAKKVSKTYVKDAVDSVLAGTKVAVPETKAHGCGIKYE